MKAVVYHAKQDVRVDEVPKPVLQGPTDAIIRVTTTAICGSDVHLYDSAVLGMRKGDIMGHEFMGIVEELGEGVSHVKVGDRVIVPFVIACGRCHYCTIGKVALCGETNPQAKLVSPFYGSSPSGLFGYTIFFGGYAGGQAEYVRVPYADFGLFKVPDSINDERALLVTDILPTGYQAALNCNISPGDTVAIAGAGPVGQLAARSALILGADRVVVIDSVPDRLAKAAEVPGVVTLNHRKQNVYKALKRMTDGEGPDSVIDAVGMEAHGDKGAGAKSRIQQAMLRQRDKPTALRMLIKAVRKGGTVSIAGVYAGVADDFPIGVVFGKSLTLKLGQTNVHTYVEELFALIADGAIDPSQIITQRLRLDDAPAAYRKFKDKEPGFLKVILTP